MEKRPYILLNKIQNYAWGTKNSEAFIPHLLDIKAENDTPYAELWIGTHPKACSEIVTGTTLLPLTDFLETNAQETLGSYCVNKFGKQFPYLLKVLSAAEALSIQAHPNKEYAKIYHAKDPKNYPDDNHKPEIAIALDKLTALAGFKPASVIADILKENPEIAGFINSDLQLDTELKSSSEQAAFLKNVFENLLNNAVKFPDKIKQTVEALIKRLSVKEGKLSETEQLFLELAAKNAPDDIGLLVVFFLELIHVKKGEAFFTGAGIPHAYIKGNIVECMANSDNVIRAGLTPKFKDIAALSEVAYYNTMPIEILKNSDQSVTKYESPVEEFKISKIDISEGGSISLSTNGSFETLLITEGQISIEPNEDSAITYKKGQTVLIPAIIDKYNIKAVEKTTVFRVTII